MTSLAVEFGEEFQGRRVLVTGATGFVGRHLCQALVTLGANVTALSRSAGPSTLPQGVIPLAVNLGRYEDVQATLAQARADLIFHLAGQVTARRDRKLVMPMFQANAAGTVHLLMAASQIKCKRLLLISSSEVLGLEKGTGPNSPYAASKLVAEIYSQVFYKLYGLPVTCMRPFLVYGPWQEETKLIPYTILTLLRGESPLLTSGERVCDAIYVQDVVRGLLMASAAASSAVGERFDLGTGKGITIRDLVEAVVKIVGTTTSPVFGALSDRSYERSEVADLRRVQSLLGWVPHWSLDDGLRETVTWYRQLHISRGVR